MKTFLLASAILSISQVPAATYIESIDGDLPWETPKILTLDFGENVISGSYFFNSTAWDSDLVGVTVPAGGSLVLWQSVFEYSFTSMNPQMLYVQWGMSFGAPTSSGAYNPSGSDICITMAPGGSGGSWPTTLFRSPSVSPFLTYPHPTSPSPLDLNFKIVEDFQATDRPAMSLSEGRYYLNQGVGGSSADSNFWGSYDYTIRLYVHPVPEPAVALLFPVALLPLLLRRRR